MQPIIEQHLPEIQKLMRFYGVEQAHVFGSAATSEMHVDSDVDFLIRFLPSLDLETYGNNYFKLLYALQDLLQKQVDLVAEETLTNPYLLESINNNKLQLL